MSGKASHPCIACGRHLKTHRGDRWGGVVVEQVDAFPDTVRPVKKSHGQPNL